MNKRKSLTDRYGFLPRGFCTIRFCLVAAVLTTSAGRAVPQTPPRLASPYETPSVITVPVQIPNPPTNFLHAPPGFRVTLYAEGLKHPRQLTVAPNGDVFCVESHLEMKSAGKQPHRVTVLRDTKGKGVADTRHVFTEDLTLPFGIAIHKGFVYVANTGSVVRWPYQNGQMQAVGAPETVISGIPERGYNQHWTRNILFDAATRKMYLTVGSKENAAEEEPIRGTIVQYALGPSGTPAPEGSILASGLRNPIGLDLNPATGALWAVVSERDYLGDNLVPDFLTSIRPGGFYGWPYYYIGKHHDPRLPERPDLRARVVVPETLFASHSAPIGLRFYNGNAFPAKWRSGAFVALHGSQNARVRQGYKVVFIRFDKRGKPVGKPTDFVTGWLRSPDDKNVYGRPAGLALDKTGALLIADDWAGRIWRVHYGP